MDTTTLAPVASEEVVGTLDEDPCIEEEMLVEEISIDGMCGVY